MGARQFVALGPHLFAIWLGCLILSSCASAPTQAVQPTIATDTTTGAAVTVAGNLPPTRPASVDATWRDQHPVLLPPEAIVAGHQGTPVVLAQIGVHGEVLKTQLEHSTGYAELDTAAVSAVRGWKFQPCYQDNRPQVCWIRELVSFTPPNSRSLRAHKLTIVQPGYSVSPEHPRYAIPWPRDEFGRPLTGTTVLVMKVGGDQGQVMSVAVEKSSGHDELDAAVMEAARHWHFTPGYEDGVAKEGFVRLPVTMEP